MRCRDKTQPLAPDTLVRTTRVATTCSARNAERFQNATSERLNVWSSRNLRTAEDIWEKGLGHYDLSYGTLAVQDVETSNLLEQFREVWKQTRDHDSIGYAQVTWAVQSSKKTRNFMYKHVISDQLEI